MTEIYPSFTFMFVLLNMIGLYKTGNIYYDWWIVGMLFLVEMWLGVVKLKMMQNVIKEKESLWQRWF